MIGGSECHSVGTRGFGQTSQQRTGRFTTTVGMYAARGDSGSPASVTPARAPTASGRELRHRRASTPPAGRPGLGELAPREALFLSNNRYRWQERVPWQRLGRVLRSFAADAG